MSPGSLLFRVGAPHKCDHAKARLDPYLCCYLIYPLRPLPPPLIWLRWRRRRRVRAKTRREFLPNEVAIPPAGNLLEESISIKIKSLGCDLCSLLRRGCRIPIDTARFCHLLYRAHMRQSRRLRPQYLKISKMDEEIYLPHCNQSCKACSTLNCPGWHSILYFLPLPPSITSHSLCVCP